MSLSAAVWGGVVVPDSSLTLSVGGQGAFSSIQAALDTAMPGNVIEVEAGSYSENLSIQFNLLELPLDSVVLRGSPGERPTIQSADNDESVIDIRDVEGFRVEGFSLLQGDESINVTRAAGFVLGNRMETSLAGSDGLRVSDSQVLVADNEFFNMRGKRDGPFRFASYAGGQRLRSPLRSR